MAHERPWSALAVVALVGAVVGLSSCSGPSVVPGPLADDPACAKVAAAWPVVVSGLEQGTSTQQPVTVRTWGDPPVIARCGVEPLTPTTDECVAVDGVDWVLHQLSDGVSATTYGRTPALEVLIPREYAPGPLLLPAFSAAAKALPTNGRSCR
jgi:hypothetical protein